MALDLAMAALLLKKEKGRNALLPHFDFGPDLMKNPRICCLKKGVAGELGWIEVGRRLITQPSARQTHGKNGRFRE